MGTRKVDVRSFARNLGHGCLGLLAMICSAGVTLATPPEDDESTPLPWTESALRNFDALQVPEGLVKRIFAAEPLIKDPVAFCIDERGRVFVCETARQERGVEDNRSSSFWLLDDLSLGTVEDRLLMYEKWKDRREGGMDYYRAYEGRIRLLEDTDSDGVAETSVIFSDGYNEPLDGTAAGVLARDGDIYFTNIPSVYRLRDQNDDGRADEKTVLSTGYGVRIALRGHDMHGLVFGPDGRLYWSIGDRGYHLELPDGRVESSPNSGAVFRCDPDGSNLEIVHHGLRNPQELAFDDYGNLFSVDNNSDGGDKARLVHIVDGGETGWQMEYQTLEGDNRRGPWNQEGIWWTRHQEQPAWVLPPVDHITSGPSGLVHYPGWGLPTRYRHHFFVCDFRGGTGNSSVRSFAVEEEGAGFQMVDEHIFADRILATDVDFGYDGRVYISDWGATWVQNGEGRIFTVEDPNWVDSQTALQVMELVREGFEHRPVVELATQISHRDQRVRLRAQWALAARGQSSEGLFIAVATKPTDTVPRLHGIWGLGQLGRAGAITDKGLVALRSLLEDSDPAARAAAAEVLGELRDSVSRDALVARLQDESLRVRAYAAGALGKTRDSASFAPLVEALRANDDGDVTLRHALSLAISRLGDPEAIGSLTDDPSRAVRMGALLALRRLRSPVIARFLSDSDETIVTECARAIYDVPIAEARPALASMLPRLRTEAAEAELDRTPIECTLEVHDLPPGSDAASLDPTDDALFATEPRARATIGSADSRGNGARDLGDRYAARLWTEIEITESGPYRFAISSDDQSVLFLEELGLPESRRAIARVEGYVGPAVWDGQSGQVSSSIELTAGSRIRIEARQIEGSGEDHLKVAWRRPDGVWERPIGGGEDPRGNVPLLRRVIGAALDLGAAPHIAGVLALASDSGLPQIARVEALRALLEWDEPNPRERVQGEVRDAYDGLRDRDEIAQVLMGRTGPEGSAGRVLRLVESSTGPIGALALQVGIHYGVPLPRQVYLRVLANRSEPVDSKVVALEQLVSTASGAAEIRSDIEFVLETDPPAALRVRALELLPETEERWSALTGILTRGTSAEQQHALAALARVSDARAEEQLAAMLDRFEAGGLAPELSLDLMRAAETRGTALLAERVAAWRASLPEGDEVAPYLITLRGGDAERGRRIFRENPIAQCSRCHVAEGDGGVAGPPLDGIASKQSRRELLESIILPSAQITEGYGTGPGEPSAMPQVHFALEPAQIRDLIEFLAGLEG